jgi:hypothetical protein
MTLAETSREYQEENSDMHIRVQPFLKFCPTISVIFYLTNNIRQILKRLSLRSGAVIGGNGSF